MTSNIPTQPPIPDSDNSMIRERQAIALNKQLVSIHQLRCVGKVLTYLIGIPILLIMLSIVALYAAITTERGTAYAWKTAVTLLGGQLVGKLEEGTFARGVRISQIEWHGTKGLEIRINSAKGKWALSREPWRFTVDFLHMGTIDARIVPLRPCDSITLPKNLRLPFALNIRDLRIDALHLHKRGSTTKFSRLILHAHSNGRYHQAWIEFLNTPHGLLKAHAKLDAMQPFTLTGAADYSSKINNEWVQIRAHVMGSLTSFVADVNARGLKLAGQGHMEIAPFSNMPLKRVTIAFDHVNLQAFIPSWTPFVDLSVRAELQPVSTGGAVKKQMNMASHVIQTVTNTMQVTQTSQKDHSFSIIGWVSIINAKPGSLNANLLPFVAANADVQLNAKAQRISNINVQLVKNATITGTGMLTGKRGHLDLQIAKLDLNMFDPSMRTTNLSGSVGIYLNYDNQSITLDLADPQTALHAQGKVTFNSALMSFNNVHLSSGTGYIDLLGTIKHDANLSWKLKITLFNFDPLSLISQRFSRFITRANANMRTKKISAQQQLIVMQHRIEARINGMFVASGVLAPTFKIRAAFQLESSIYNKLPLTGAGILQLADSHILPSKIHLSIAGNKIDLQGSFGKRGDRLRVAINAPKIARLGFGCAGSVTMNSDITGSFAHPSGVLSYKANGVVFGANRIGYVQGHAEIREGLNDTFSFTTDVHNIAVAGIDLAKFTMRFWGTRAKHTLKTSAVGRVHNQPIDLAFVVSGCLTETRKSTHWDGMVTHLKNYGTPEINLKAPLTVTIGKNKVALDDAQLMFEGAALNLKSFVYDNGTLHSAGTLTEVQLARVFKLCQKITGTKLPVKTDLVFNSDWDFSLGEIATGYLTIKRHWGDVILKVGRSRAALGIRNMTIYAVFGNNQRLTTTMHAQASRIGKINATAYTALIVRNGLLTIGDKSPLHGSVNFDVPSLKTTSSLFGPRYLLDGQFALKLALAGILGKPSLSGSLVGKKISAIMVDQGMHFKNGAIQIALTENLVDFQQIEFHGTSGTLRANGQIRLDNFEPNLTASIIADRLELFASPNRRLSLSGNASVVNAKHTDGLAINGKFIINHALFDIPEQLAPVLGDDVVIMQSDDTFQNNKSLAHQIDSAGKLAKRFTPHANINLYLGNNFHFHGLGADLNLRGTITTMSAPNLLLRAVGNVRVAEGSIYTVFGRKLAIENGFFTFNGPVANPGVNILAMRRNQKVEVGVQVTGTLQSPNVQLVSEPSVGDNEKLSWLLFGHGTDQGNNLGQQRSMSTALGLLGSASGTRIAQAIGLDEFSIGRSDVGITDPQVVLVSKAINEWLVLGYEQGLQSATNAIKATINLTRYWSIAAYGGTFKGIELFYTRRFDRIY